MICAKPDKNFLSGYGEKVERRTEDQKSSLELSAQVS
jgi:hypothetical protein